MRQAPDEKPEPYPLPPTAIRALQSIRGFQDRLLKLLGSTLEGRAQLTARMLERNANETTSYWLQLVVSVGIATLGLVLGSVAVIIGAMLVAPLMGPIIALAMGLATGSPFLVLRAASRILLSVVVAIGGAALITVLLPFHDLNTEIASRTAPTVLDLLTAGFCALAGVYASLRPGSDTATTAAGTSIGISLVPPLCASGYGLGTQIWPVAGGAALLFLTNLVAIIFVGMSAFVAAGFNRVDTTRLEQDELAKSGQAQLTAAISRRLSRLFGSRAGPALRFVMPLVLLALVYIPLRHALDEMAWEVRVRAAVQEALAKEPRKIVQSRVRVERKEVQLLVVLVGNVADADQCRARLTTEIQIAAGVLPGVEVLAIPDATALAGLESTLLRTTRDRLPLPPRPAPSPPSPAEQLESARRLVHSEVTRLWPAAASGEPLVIDVDTGAGETIRVRVVHLGPPLGPAGAETLERSLGAALEREVELVAVAVPTEWLTRAEGDLQLVSRLSTYVRASAGIGEIHVCVKEPPPAPKRRRANAREQELENALRAVLEQHPRVTSEPGKAWEVRFARGGCTVPAPPSPIDVAPASAPE